MGLIYIEASVAHPARPKRSVGLKFLLDSGALYSVVPSDVLRKLGVKPRRTRSFILADGNTSKRRMGEALFRLGKDEGTSPVIFGQKDDSLLLGSVTLDVLGFILDPLKRELRPAPMLLVAHEPR